MGIVYEAFDHDRQMPVALKTLRWVDAQSIFSLKTEFRARADLEHRNLVRLGELHRDDGHWFFTMELVKGVDFLDWVRGDGQDERIYDERRLRSALRQLATGLVELHRAGMIHRDLKPSNVMVTDDARVVLLDFGLIADTRAQLSDSTVVGTAAYMSPEQAMSRPPGPASDWYSVGVMLYQAFTGRLPIEGAPLEIMMRKQRRRPPRRVHGAPEDLSALCVALLAVDPAARPTGADVLRMLEVRSDERVETPFVGRVAELGVLDRALADVRGGGTIAISVEGESGIGKTKLVRHFIERISADADAPLVLSGRCHERETLPFKGLDGIVDALARILNKIELDELPPSAELTALAQTFPVLLRVPAIAREAAPLPANLLELRARAFRALRRLFDAVSAVQPLVVTIDDIQWADSDSLALLAELLHGPASPRLLLVLTRRHDVPPPTLPIAITHLHLAPLTAAEAAELVALTAPERAGESADLNAGAGGHPMFLRELLRHDVQLRSAGLDDAIWARITRMNEAARRIIELVAIAGRPLPQGIVSEVLELEPRTAAKWFGVLRAASLVRTGGNRAGDPIEPYHDRVRAAVLTRIPLGRRRRYHDRLAAILLAGGYAERDPLLVVEHLEAAGRREQAGSLARRGVRRIVDQVAFEQVAALCTAALRLADEELPADERRALIVRRAEALALAGRGAEAARDYLEAAAGASDDKVFHHRRAAAEQLLVSGHITEGLALLRECMGEIGEHLPSRVSSARRALIGNMIWLRLRGTRYRERPTNNANPQDQLRLDLHFTAALGLSLVDTIPGALCLARGLRTALQLGDRRRIAYALAYHGMYSAAGGERLIHYGRTLVAQARQIAQEDRNLFLLGWARCADGVVEYFAGNFESAVEKLIDAEAQLREHTVGTAPELNHLRMFLMFAMRRNGCYDRLRGHYLEYVRDATRRGDRYATTSFRWSANAVWLAADDTARARSELAGGAWSPRADGLHLQHWFLARAHAELALYEGDADALRVAREELTTFVATPLRYVEVVRAETALTLARVAILERDLPAARHELVQLRRERAPYLRAMALLVEAAADQLEGRHDEARAHLADATALCESSRMQVVAALARRRTGQALGGALGERITTDADAVLRRHGIIDCARFARAFATWPEPSP